MERTLKAQGVLPPPPVGSRDRLPLAAALIAYIKHLQNQLDDTAVTRRMKQIRLELAEQRLAAETRRNSLIR